MGEFVDSLSLGSCKNFSPGLPPQPPNCSLSCLSYPLKYTPHKSVTAGLLKRWSGHVHSSGGSPWHSEQEPKPHWRHLWPCTTCAYLPPPCSLISKSTDLFVIPCMWQVSGEPQGLCTSSSPCLQVSHSYGSLLQVFAQMSPW